jgi:hypothetical protein
MTLCAKCGEREATRIWTESALAHVHGMSERRCEQCVVEAQLEFCRKRAEAIPELERRLRELTEEDS